MKHNRLRQRAATQELSGTLQRRTERLTIIPRKLFVSRMEKYAYRREGMSPRHQSIVDKARRLGFSITATDDRRDDGTWLHFD